MSTLNIGFTRRVEVAMIVDIINKDISADELKEGLTVGTYEVMIGSGEIINNHGEVVARYAEFEEVEDYHSNFELF